MTYHSERFATHRAGDIAKAHVERGGYLWTPMHEQSEQIGESSGILCCVPAAMRTFSRIMVHGSARQQVLDRVRVLDGLDSVPHNGLVF